MTASSDRLRLLRGVDTPPGDLRELRAGPVSLLLDGIDLRYVRIGSTELVRRVYAAVRDVDWDTVPGAVSGLRIEETDSSFRIEFDVRHARREIDFAWHGAISGDDAGRIEYVFDGRANGPLPYNRIGLCVHHPWRETAGAAFSARTPDGPLEGSFPDLIGPQSVTDGRIQPLFPSFDRLEVELAVGGRLLLEFEGDLWETEDHRNWTDANFKTYSTPLAAGRPTPLEAGQALVQRLVITPRNVPAATAASGPVRLTVGEPTGTKMPAVGLGADRDAHRLDGHESALLRRLGPAHLRVDVRLDREDWREALAAAQESAGPVGARLELALMLREEHAELLPEVSAALASGPAVERVIVTVAGGRTSTPEESTPVELVDLVRAALAPAVGAAAFVGGTEIYFTELNRTRRDPSGWDGVSYSISPQIHAFTDIDVMENLDVQSETVRSAHALAAGKPVIVSPITIRRRFNFHAAGDPPPTLPGELPDAVDPRQSALFGAAWTAGSLKYVAEAGVASVTYYESTGWRGVLERSSGCELPERFRSRPGEPFPLYHPLADAIEWTGAEVLACASSDVLVAVALAVRTGDGAVGALVANLTGSEQPIVLGPLEGTFRLRRLNESTAGRAAADPAAFRAAADEAAAAGRELALTLGPYEVVRVDPAPA